MSENASDEVSLRPIPSNSVGDSKYTTARKRTAWKEITITISGTRGAGKSLLAAAIGGCLRRAGFYNVIVEEDLAPPDRKDWAERFPVLKAGLRFISPRKVTIKTGTVEQQKPEFTDEQAEAAVE